MNHCEAMRDALTDVALGRDASEALSDHLAQCGSCKAELERRRALARRMDAAVVAMVNSQPTSRLPEQIAARTRSASQAKPVRRAWPGFAIGAALAASIVAVIVGIRAVPPPATPGRELTALSAWHSPTASLMESRGSVLVVPLRDNWPFAEPRPSHTAPTPGVSHAL